MKYAKKLRKGDKVAIVSLSSGMLGEAFCSHNIEIGVKRLREYGLETSFMPNSLKGIEYLKANPKARAKDLKDAFMDDSIAGIICAIGGDDTYRLLPYLLEDEEFIDAVHKSPKLFTGFSDTTINHLMFYKLGLSTYYGPNFICDLAEISDEMLPYSKKAFESYIEGNEYREITSSEIWYQKRTDFSKEAVGTERISHKEEHGFELLQVIVARADHNKEHMGLKSWKNAPDGKIVKTDVSIAKNYLGKEELAELNEIVTMYLDYATRQARRHIPMTMEDWKTKLDAFLRFNDAEVLQDKGKVTAAIAKEFAESEFEKYRVIQDSLYESDFDKLMNDMEKDDAIH